MGFTDNFRGTISLDVEDVQALRVVDVANQLTIGRPADLAVEAFAFHGVLFYFALAFVRRDVQFVLAPRIGKVGN